MEFFDQNFINATEQIKPLTATVKGNLPDWLRGDLIRVGPGKFDLDSSFNLNHWLDGLAFVYKFSFKGNNQVTFHKRFVESDAYKRAHKAGRPVYTEFGTKAYPDFTKSLFSRIVSNFDASSITDNTSLNIMRVGNEIFVSSETCYLRRIEQSTLETKEKIDLHKIVGINFATSHVVTDNNGAAYNIGITLFPVPKYHVLKTQPSNNNSGKDVWLNTKNIATISSSWKTSYSYTHSFAITENYLVFAEHPLLVNALKLATSQVKGRALGECIEWHPSEAVRFIVVNLHSGEALRTKYVCNETFWVMHHANAYEQDDQIVIDFVAYPDPTIIDKLFLDKVRNREFGTENPAQLYRFVIPIVEEIQDLPEDKELVTIPNIAASAKRSRKESYRGDAIILSGIKIGEQGLDMPTFHSSKRGKPYKFLYGNGGFDQGFYKNSVCKLNLETGISQLWHDSEYQFPSEPIFVPQPYCTYEEDGVVLISVVDTRKDYQDYLVILDGHSFKEIARVEISEKIPNLLHGIFVPDTASQI